MERKGEAREVLDTPTFVMSGGFGCFYAPQIGPPPGDPSKIWVSKVTSRAEAQKADTASKLLAENWDPRGDFHVKVEKVVDASYQERKDFPCKIRDRDAIGAIMQMEYGGISLEGFRKNLSIERKGQEPLKLDRTFFEAFENIFRAFAVFTSDPRKIFIHGDLKPDNILIGLSGGELKCRLIDFDWSVALVPSKGINHNPFEGVSSATFTADPYVYWPPELYFLKFARRGGFPAKGKGDIVKEFLEHAENVFRKVNQSVAHQFDLKETRENAKRMVEEKFDTLFESIDVGSSFVKHYQLKPKAIGDMLKKFDTFSLGVTLLELLAKRSMIGKENRILRNVPNMADEALFRKLSVLASQMVNVDFTQRLNAQDTHHHYQKLIAKGIFETVWSYLSPSLWFETFKAMFYGETRVKSEPVKEAVVSAAPPILQPRLRAHMHPTHTVHPMSARGKTRALEKEWALKDRKVKSAILRERERMSHMEEESGEWKEAERRVALLKKKRRDLGEEMRVRQSLI